MPMIKVSEATMALIKDRTTPGYQFRICATKQRDGLWNVPVDDEVAARIAYERLPGECDDEVVARLIRAAIDQRPN